MIKDRRMFGMFEEGLAAFAAEARAAAPPPVWNEAAISWKPVCWGFIGTAGGARPCDGIEEKGLEDCCGIDGSEGSGGCCCCC